MKTSPRAPGRDVGLGRDNRVPKWAITTGPFDGGRSFQSNGCPQIPAEQNGTR
jgi:hypothetical protein